ncbi:MAG TPA: TadE/TadG family type IV pilus assembly protein [Pyrinomonadaceae bacterium]|nr:TadE/TadG family type IV pilus assembly protein [Pyrinomonadaceae bacterium]
MLGILSKKVSSFRRNECGVQLVELAIALPVLVLLFAAVAEFGRYFYEYTTLAKGSRTAVRFLATARTNGEDDEAAQNLVVYGNLAGTGSPIVSGLKRENVDITRHDINGGLVTEGIPNTVTIRIKDFNHSPVFNLGKLVTASASLNIEVKPSVTMRYLLTQTPS